ncbi:hypothetical protein [Nevskia ramosa]|uniref:hypothetical protein n=1 Tax=Nevskia ramosa TaxID=64002 RepID=UPI003D122734
MTDQTESQTSDQTKPAETPASEAAPKTETTAADAGVKEGSAETTEAPAKRGRGRPPGSPPPAEPDTAEAAKVVNVSVTNHSSHTLIDPESGKFITACSITPIACLSKGQFKRLKNSIAALREANSIDESKLFIAVEPQ